MKHNKDNHKEVVTFCWKFEAGNCLFGNQKCWFIHNEVKESTDYTCKLCDNTFPNLPELMKHKKEYHIQTVQVCKNRICIYGREKCWYKHKESEKEMIEPIEEEFKNNKNEETTERIFKMMDNFKLKITEIENQMKMTNK